MFLDGCTVGHKHTLCGRRLAAQWVQNSSNFLKQDYLTARFLPTPILVSRRLTAHLRQQILRGCSQARVLGEQCSAFVLHRSDHVPHPIFLSAISTFRPLTTGADERRSVTNRLETAKARHELAQPWTRRFAREPGRKQLRNFSTFFLHPTHIA